METLGELNGNKIEWGIDDWCEHRGATVFPDCMTVILWLNYSFLMNTGIEQFFPLNTNHLLIPMISTKPRTD